jgi:tellurite resistance protein TerC
LAEELPPKLQKKAIYIGIGLGALFRLICLFVASIIIENPIIKFLGGLYLLYLAFEHFFRSKKDEKELKKHPHFKKVIVEIALADLVFSIDNVVGAVGISSNFAYVITGVIIGIITMIFVTPLMLILMRKAPSLVKTAYGIIAYIGFSILLAAFFHIHIHEYITFILILIAVLGTIYIDGKKRHTLMKNL